MADREHHMLDLPDDDLTPREHDVVEHPPVESSRFRRLLGTLGWFYGIALALAVLTLMAFGIWKGRIAPRWVSVAIWAFVAGQFLSIPGNTVTVLQFVLLTVAATGAAVAANDGAHDAGATTVAFRR